MSRVEAGRIQQFDPIQNSLVHLPVVYIDQQLTILKDEEPCNTYAEAIQKAGQYVPQIEKLLGINRIKQPEVVELKEGEIECPKCRKPWDRDFYNCPHCGNEVPF